MTESVRGLPEGTDAILGLGSNVGDARFNLERAIAALTADGGVRLTRRSKDYRTEPWGKIDQDPFVNACIGVATALAPLDLLGRCKGVELAMGRVRAERWGPRVIDVDILVYGTGIITEPDLVVPHPLIASRGFVLAPLQDIAPGLSIGGVTVAEFLARVGAAGVTPL